MIIPTLVVINVKESPETSHDIILECNDTNVSRPKYLETALLMDAATIDMANHNGVGFDLLNMRADIQKQGLSLSALLHLQKQ